MSPDGKVIWWKITDGFILKYGAGIPPALDMGSVNGSGWK